MALSDKNIVITPNISSSTDDPKIVFSGASSTLGPQNITLKAYPTNGGTLSFEGSAGQLFSITNSLTGTIFSVSDISGIPSIEVLDTGLVKLAQYGGNILLGSGTDNGNKLQVTGQVTITPTLNFSNAIPALNVGGTGDGRIQVRHIWGKEAGSASPDHLWLNYQNGSKHVQIGDSGGGNNLYVSGTIYSGGYFTGTQVVTNSGSWSISVTGSAGSVAASGITGQTGMWTSAARPGPYRLYRRDDNSDYSVQTNWNGTHWVLYGYNGDSGHAGCRVAYADSAGNGGVTSVNGQTGAVTVSGGVSFGKALVFAR